MCASRFRVWGSFQGVPWHPKASFKGTLFFFLSEIQNSCRVPGFLFGGFRISSVGLRASRACLGIPIDIGPWRAFFSFFLQRLPWRIPRGYRALEGFVLVFFFLKVSQGSLEGSS